MSTSKKHKSYEDLEALKQALGEQTAKLRAELNSIEDKLAAVTMSIQLLKGKGLKAGTSVITDPYLNEFKGLTQVEGLIKLAKDSGTNRFKLREAKKTLVDAGLVKSKKNAATILFTTIQRSEKFKRVAPGEYEVRPTAEEMIDRVVKGEKPSKVVESFTRSA